MFHPLACFFSAFVRPFGEWYLQLISLPGKVVSNIHLLCLLFIYFTWSGPLAPSMGAYDELMATGKVWMGGHALPRPLAFLPNHWYPYSPARILPTHWYVLRPLVSHRPLVPCPPTVPSPPTHFLCTYSCLYTISCPLTRILPWVEGDWKRGYKWMNRLYKRGMNGENKRNEKINEWEDTDGDSRWKWGIQAKK